MTPQSRQRSFERPRHWHCACIYAAAGSIEPDPGRRVGMETRSNGIYISGGAIALIVLILLLIWIF
jgi:hypothetical protein